MTLNFNFTNKHALVTGGACGIGFEITRQFLSAGASVAVWDFSSKSLAKAAAELAGFGSRISFQQVDVSKIETCTKAALELPFAIDILVNNAGITRDKSLAKMTAEDFDTVVQTNLSGVFYVTKSLLTKFKAASDHKRIISLASVVALYGNFGQTNYVAAKAGVIGMTKTWARELGRKGFTVNAIAPGFTLTSMVEAMPADAKTGLEDKIPLGRMAQPRDIASACLFLASDEAAYINGTCLSVDGGLIS